MDEYENQFLTTKILEEAKQSIWHKINDNITKLWPSFQIIFEQEGLVQRVKEVVEKTKIEIENRQG